MGKFVRGKSGNPGGRPRVVAALRALCQDQTEANILTLVKIRDDPGAPHTARIAAVRELNDRAFGKPTQPIAGDGEREIVRFIVDGLGTKD
jgi:hypothetical protein